MNLYDREYFEDGTTGYSLYRDFPCHYLTVEAIRQFKPESVLEIGGARGYIVKKLEDSGIPSFCLEVSEHCWHTRVTDSFLLHDITKSPWPLDESPWPIGKFDLCFSIAVLEHLPEDKLDSVIHEMARFSKRGFHGVTFEVTPEDIDQTHQTMHPKEWWLSKFEEIAPDYAIEIVDKEELERGNLNLDRLAPSDKLVKLNIGCFQDCYYYGWENWDIVDLSQWAKHNGYLFKRVDVTNGIPKEVDSVDLILVSHLIEHLNRDAGSSFIQECHRVLKPSGLLRIATPDIRLLCRKFLSDKISTEYASVNLGVERAEDESDALFHLLFKGHSTLYDFDALKTLLERSGFHDVKKMPPFKSQSETLRKQTVSMYPTLSLYIEARPRK